MTSLTGKVVLITGGAGGIAQGIAQAILDQGGRIGLVDLDPARIDAAASSLASSASASAFSDASLSFSAMPLL